MMRINVNLMYLGKLVENERYSLTPMNTYNVNICYDRINELFIMDILTNYMNTKILNCSYTIDQLFTLWNPVLDIYQTLTGDRKNLILRYTGRDIPEEGLMHNKYYYCYPLGMRTDVGIFSNSEMRNSNCVYGLYARHLEGHKDNKWRRHWFTLSEFFSCWKTPERNE